MTRREFIALISSAAAIRPLGARAERPPERVLYFTYSAGYRHDVIPLSEAILTQLGRNSGTFEVIATEDMSEFSTGNLERYAAVMFYHNRRNSDERRPKDSTSQLCALGPWLPRYSFGHGHILRLAGLFDLIGGYFNGHPWHQGVTIEVADAADPVVAFLGNSLQLNDEIYQISDFDYRGSRVLLRLDQSSVDLSKTGVHQRFYGWPLCLETIFRRGTSILFGARPRSVSLAGPALPENPHERYPLDYEEVGLESMFLRAASFDHLVGAGRAVKGAR